MSETLIATLRSLDKHGYWNSRDLFKAVRCYSTYRSFQKAIERAIAKCPQPSDHFHYFLETRKRQRACYTYNLTAYACELVFNEVQWFSELEVILSFFSDYQNGQIEDMPLHEDDQKIIQAWVAAYECGMEFPINFNIAWHIADYPTKEKAKETLIGKNSDFGLIENFDYIIKSDDFHQTFKSNFSEASNESIYLTADAFISLCFEARTAKSRASKEFFIKTKRELRQIQLPPLSPSEQKEFTKLQLKRTVAEIERDKALAELKLQKVIANIAEQQFHNEGIAELCNMFKFVKPNGETDFAKYRIFYERLRALIPYLVEEIDNEFPPNNMN
jgi:phage anti-repressor protein